jgi:NADH:ubiquinone oxidoreductase subunit 2 (subunit N)
MNHLVTAQVATELISLAVYFMIAVRYVAPWLDRGEQTEATLRHETVGQGTASHISGHRLQEQA